MRAQILLDDERQELVVAEGMRGDKPLNACNLLPLRFSTEHPWIGSIGGGGNIKRAVNEILIITIWRRTRSERQKIASKGGNTEEDKSRPCSETFLAFGIWT
jgi:hypothetical protein